MRDCFYPTRVALGLPKRSPFKFGADLKLNQLKEAGIVRPNLKAVLVMYDYPTNSWHH